MTIINFNPYYITLVATKADVKIEDSNLGEYMTLKIIFYDNNSNFLINYYLSIEGDDYKRMVTSQDFDGYIKKFIENKLNLSII